MRVVTLFTLDLVINMQLCFNFLFALRNHTHHQQNSSLLLLCIASGQWWMKCLSRWGMNTMCYWCPQWETITRTSCGMRGIHSVTQNCTKPVSITSVTHCQFSTIQWYRIILSTRCLFIRYTCFCWNRRSTSHHQVIPWPNSMEQLTVPQLFNKFPTFYATQRFIITFTRTTPPHLSLHLARSILSMSPVHFLKINFILPFHLNLGFPNLLFPSGF